MAKQNLFKIANNLAFKNVSGGDFERETSSVIIDIRPRLAYLANHIANSINLSTKDEILDFITKNPKDEYILCCSSSIRARNLALQIDNKNVKFYN